MPVLIPVLAGVALLSVVATAQGQPGGAAFARFEIAPYMGYRRAGEFNVGDAERNANLDDHGSFALAFSLHMDEESQYQLFYSRQEARFEANLSGLEGTRLDIEYLHFAGTLTPDPALYLKPYVIGAIGLTQFSPSGVGADDDTRFSIAIGGGVRLPIRPRFDVLLEARGFVTFVSAGSSAFCASGSTGAFCALNGNGSTFLQYELLAGVAFSF